MEELTLEAAAAAAGRAIDEFQLRAARQTGVGAANDFIDGVLHQEAPQDVASQSRRHRSEVLVLGLLGLDERRSTAGSVRRGPHRPVAMRR